MRTTADRVRHAISFEVIGIVLMVPLGSIGFGLPPKDIGAVAVLTSFIATVWNYFFNMAFDRMMRRWKGRTRKTAMERVIHALLFEAGLLILTLPLLAKFLGIGLWQALVLDGAVVLFFLVYAFVFNWVYDLLFPATENR